MGCPGDLEVPTKEFHLPVRYVDMSVSERGDEEDQRASPVGLADSATRQEAGLVTDPLGLGYFYPPPDCVGVLSGYSVLAVAHKDSVTSNSVHSVHPGSFRVNLCMNSQVNIIVSYHLTSPV